MAKRKDEAVAVLDSPKRFRVHLAASTPLVQPTAEVEAETPEEAWEKFCQLNGISGSSCEREITALD